MKELGEYLQQTRQKKGISLEAISERTKIPLRYLTAIEQGNFQRMPGEVYLKGFLRGYAETIGLEPEEVVQRYKELCQQQMINSELAAGEAITSESAEKHLVEGIARGVPKQRLKPTWSWEPQRFLSIAVVLLLVLGGIWVFMGRWQAEPEVIISQPEPLEESPVPGEVEEKPLPVKTWPIATSLTTKERCWLEVYADGEQLVAKSFEPGEHLQYNAEKRLALLLGRPATVQITFGSTVLTDLGKNTATLVFYPDGTYLHLSGRHNKELYLQP